MSGFRGHPPGLYVLFATEFWERYAFYSLAVDRSGRATVIPQGSVDLAPWSEDAWKTLASILRSKGGEAIKEAQEADDRAHRAATDHMPDLFSPTPDNELQRDACRAYARMFNRLDYGQLEP